MTRPPEDDHVPSPVPRVPNSLRLRVLLWRLRLPVCAVLLGLAVAVAVGQLRPPAPVTERIAVTTRPLAAGHVLTADDLAPADVAAGVVPAAAHADPEELVGAGLAVDVPAGLPIVVPLLAPAVATGPPGTVVAPVRFADAGVAGLLAPGTRVDVLATAQDGSEVAGPADGARSAGEAGPTDGSGATSGSGSAVSPRGTVLASAALVLPAPVSAGAVGADGAGPGLLSGAVPGAAPGSPGSVPVLLAVTPAEAVALAGASGFALLSAVIVE
ncbi:SAF domain-containing protein [Cellulomonas hominis]